MSRIAAYMRISVVERHENLLEETINSQRKIIERYIQEQEDLKNSILEEFVDEGYSGNSISRPGLDRLIEKIKKQQVDCIIVKDMSRFMRNYIEMGNYLENIFPFMGVRFIAINDGYDSKTEVQNGTSIDIQFKNLINDYYCRELSVKMKSTLHSAYNKGKYITGYPSYGYMKDPNDYTKIIPDPETADNVRYMFQLALENKSLMDIAKVLNREGIITPGRKRSKDVGYDLYNSRTKKDISKSLWSHSMIRRILINETYVGTFVFNKSTKTKLDGGKSTNNKKAEWKKIHNHHEAIVSQDDYDKVQLLLNARYRNGFKKRQEYSVPSILLGVVKCQKCGYALSIINNSDIKPLLYCKSCRSNSLKSRFVDIRIVEKEIVDILRTKFDIKNEDKLELEKEKDKLVKLNQRLSDKKLSYFEDYKLEKIDREAFKRIKDNIQMDIDSNNERISEIEDIVKKTSGIKQYNNETVKKYISAIYLSDKGIERIEYN